MEIVHKYECGDTVQCNHTGNIGRIIIQTSLGLTIHNRMVEASDFEPCYMIQWENNKKHWTSVHSEKSITRVLLKKNKKQV